MLDNHPPTPKKFLTNQGENTLSKHARPIARLVPADTPVARDGTVFSRIRALHSRLALLKGETAKDLIEAGRRI